MKYKRKKIGSDNFELKSMIGRGSLSRVFLVFIKDTKRYHVVKIISKNEIIRKKKKKEYTKK